MTKTYTTENHAAMDAAELDALRAENARLREALEPLAAWAELERREHKHNGQEAEAEYMGRLADAARAALEKAGLP